MQQQEGASLCTAGCGFFGNAASHGMCSVCWKKSGSKIPIEAPSAEQVSEPSVTAQSTDNDTAAAIDTTPVQEPKEIQTNKSRCWECKKKIGLTGIECRCGYIFCGVHRYADQHKCSFDYKAAEVAELAKRNPGGGAFTKLDKL